MQIIMAFNSVCPLASATGYSRAKISPAKSFIHEFMYSMLFIVHFALNQSENEWTECQQQHRHGQQMIENGKWWYNHKKESSQPNEHRLNAQYVCVCAMCHSHT